MEEQSRMEKMYNIHTEFGVPMKLEMVWCISSHES
jgi:hypothetical protein